jgi:hypothetical protein
VVDVFVDHCYDNMEELFPKKQEQKVVDAVLTLFKTRRDLEIFRKKALYIYIREMTDCETPTLTKVVSRLKQLFQSTTATYLDAGYSIV